ncbi:MOSC domain-containing protein [Teichococcus vastitatis]|uniref:MOSC domain-containing protein n=1 Tax=Teichococcus vastitatis TaxID=2307076 RepID=A0ABS9WCR1_9PROT|nr:MOSC domain-containing protein [Pseudoroseomonas vastitatis]MCI0757100.1 MOSC domain-containing protein [Pseudoroseomonas vastitatis]
MSDVPFGTIAALWRYPVSSLGGERLEEVPVAAAGFPDDRAYGVFHAETGEIAYPGRNRRWATVPRAFSRVDSQGKLEISGDGSAWSDPDQPNAGEAFSAQLGFPAAIRRYSEDGAAPRYQRAPIHLLTTTALRTLRAALPHSLIDERRFRPNILVETSPELEGVPEYALRGRSFHIGRARLRGTVACARCAFTTLMQDDLPEDRDVYRTLLHHFGRDFGIYCEVEEPGLLRVGDHVF